MKTRDVLRWNFSPLDLWIVIGLAIAGLAWGVVDRITGRCD